MITKLDFVAIPSRDSERSRTFYIETLGLREDEHARFEAWAGETCFGIWEPERLGRPFASQKNGHIALHVDDVANGHLLALDKGKPEESEIGGAVDLLMGRQ